MGIPKETFRDCDIFNDYSFEDVVFRFEHQTRRFFRRFYDSAEEDEVPHDNGLLNDAMRFGCEVDAKTYWTLSARSELP